MEEVQEKSVSNPLAALTGRLNIRSKLLLAFMTMIALTVVVIVISFISQRYSSATIDELVQVQSHIARQSLATDRTLKQMNSLEKDFLLNYKEEGIQQAKDKYLNPMLIASGDAFQNLYEIEQVAAEEDKAKAQTAIDSINDYMAAFIATVNELELRVDPDFGELTKLQEAQALLQSSVDKSRNPALTNRVRDLFELAQTYAALQTTENANAFIAEASALTKRLGNFGLDGRQRANVKQELDNYSKWFSQVAETDRNIDARIAAYQQAVQSTDPVIQNFLSNATANEEKALTGLNKTQTNILYTMLAVGIAAVILGALIAFLLARGLTGQIDRIMELLGNMGMGDFEARTEVISTDELGTMATALNSMLDNITVLIQSQDERDQIQESIITLMEEIGALTDGDLTARAEVTEDITGAIADSFNTMADQFGGIVRQVRSATFAVDDTAADVARLTGDLASKSQEQSDKVSQAIQNVRSMAKSIEQVSTDAVKSAKVSEASRISAHEGAQTVEQTNRSMEEIREQINETARSIKRLGESSMEIGNVVQIINDIADRTSILALNASIQAAMAGDAGHGFAVVAEEVQRLAESSSNSTKQIDVLVRSIQSEIKDVSNRMDESIGKVVQGSQLADSAYGKLQEIEQVSDRLDELIASITQTASDQVQASTQIVAAMEEVGGVSQETSKASQDTADSMVNLNKTAGNLRQAVEVFRVDTAAAQA